MNAHPAISLACCLLGVGLSGCAMTPAVSHMAMDYNEFVAQATNSQTVINILRARDNTPFHFTSFSQIHGSATLQAQASLGATLTPRSAITKGGTGSVPGASATDLPYLGLTQAVSTPTSFTPSVGVQVNTGTDFDIAINSTDDFWKGIEAPLSPTLVVYYLRNGWNAQLMSYLLIDSIQYAAVVRQPAGKDKPGIKEESNYNSVELPFIGKIVNTLLRENEQTAFNQAIDCHTLFFQHEVKSGHQIDAQRYETLKGISKDVLAEYRKKDIHTVGTSPVIAGVEASSPAGHATDYIQIDDDVDAFTLALSPRGGLPPAPEGGDYAGFVPAPTLVEEKDEACAPNDRAIEALLYGVWGKLGGEQIFRADIGTFMLGAENQDLRYKHVDHLGARMPNNHIDRAYGALKSHDDKTGSATFKGEDYCTPALLPKLQKAGWKCNLDISINIRAAEGVLYYLGVYARFAPSTDIISRSLPLIDPHKIPIIVISTTPISQNDLLASVNYRGRVYYVPTTGRSIGSKFGYTSETLTLVQQLFNLNRSAKDLPSTPYVRLANP